ncbi:MAG: hypothetical protein NE330_01950, partial [Lentisphaeraceae bacterium]|nr:hypothetical protein [Lentisphaeraceae bacterium]
TSSNLDKAKNKLAEAEKMNSVVSRSAAPVTVIGLANDLSATASLNVYSDYDNYKIVAEQWDKIKQLSEEELYELYRTLDENSEKGVSYQLSNMIYSRLADINPEKAMNHITEKGNKNSMYNVMNKWAKTDPFAAFEWNKLNEESLPNNYRFETVIFQRMAEIDATKAIESIDSLDAAKHYNALQGILKTVEATEEFQAIASIMSLKQGSDRQMEAIVYSWARKSPQDAISWTESITDEDQKKKALSKIKQGWMREEPEVAAKWIMENGTDKNRAIRDVINGWSYKDGKNVIAFVDAQTMDNKDQAYESLVNRYSWNNTEVARDAVDKIEDLKRRKKAIERVFRSLRYRKSSSALEFLENRTELSTEEKEKLIAKKGRR